MIAGLSNKIYSFSASLLLLYFLISCNTSRKISQTATLLLLDDTAISKGHAGISIYEPATGKYWYEHDADKYFVPGSNVKLFTLYAGMKYLGDSLVGARVEETPGRINIYGTGDPTFLHPDFSIQPVFDYLASNRLNKVYLVNNQADDYSRLELFKVYGKGWSWDDYQESYMPERSFFPLYGNVARFYVDREHQVHVIPKYFRYDWWNKTDSNNFIVKREVSGNVFYVIGCRPQLKPVSVPFRTIESYYTNSNFDVNIIADILSDTLGCPVSQLYRGSQNKTLKLIHSQPTDSVLKPMMHNSDNFFAEQLLMMVSNEQYGYMGDDVIDSLLAKDLTDVPQKPKWVDGSGLSRYNLFTPRDFVFILNKLQQEFGLERLKRILTTGNEGTLKNYFTGIPGYVFAKTGTLGNISSLSGYIITAKGKLLIFSLLANGYQTGATPVRRAFEHFLLNLHQEY